MLGIVLERFLCTGALWVAAAEDVEARIDVNALTGAGVGGAETEVGGACVVVCCADDVTITSLSSSALQALFVTGS